MVQAGELPSLSIIVPVMNMVRTIGDLLESLMDIDYDKDKLEIIIVDGNSRDGTREIIEEYPVTLVQQEGRGLNAARNTGIKYSSGDIIAYTDGDCVVPRDWAKAIVENFRDPSVGVVGGIMEGYDKSDLLSNYIDETFFQVTPGFRYRIETTDLRLMQFPAGANMAFRRSALARVSFFDENITYGFDDLQPVEALGFKGFRIVLDPSVNIRHQHRSNIWALMKQHFNYGRGGTLLVIHKRTSLLASWFASYLIFTMSALGIFTFLLYLGIRLRHPMPFNIVLGSFGIFTSFIMIYYLPISVLGGKIWKLFAYPVLDILRGFAFTCGGVYQLFKSLSKRVIR
ncbi:MAG: glycosyltransferase [Candidatus Bathyarchaeota archaeon]|nr:glycosyltransferase [Candidatus Bathyarchaeota archaeon]